MSGREATKIARERRQARITTSGSRTRPASLIQPGIYHAHPAFFKVGGISGGDRSTVRHRNSRNLRVEYRNRSSTQSTIHRNWRKRACRGLIEGEHPPCKELDEHTFGNDQQCTPAFS